MTFIESAKSSFQNYATFSGRAVRSEFWYYQLFVVLAGIVLTIVDVIIFGANSDIQLFSALFSLAVFIPSLAIGSRRLHDTDRSAWWLLIGIIPLIGLIVLIVFWAQSGTEGPNRFGEDMLV